MRDGRALMVKTRGTEKGGEGILVFFLFSLYPVSGSFGGFILHVHSDDAWT